MNNQVNATNSLAHTKWNCKYHIVLHQNTEEKYFFMKKEKQYGRLLRHYVIGKV